MGPFVSRATAGGLCEVASECMRTARLSGCLPNGMVYEGFGMQATDPSTAVSPAPPTSSPTTSRCRASSITASSSAPWIRRRGATSGGPRRSTHACGMPRRGWRGSAAPSSAPARRASTTTWSHSCPRSAGRVLPPRSPCTELGGSARRLVLPHTFRAVDVRRRRAAVRGTRARAGQKRRERV